MKRFVILVMVFGLAILLDSLAVLDISPHGPCVSYALFGIDDIAFGLLGSGLLGFGGSLLSAGSQRSANAANLQAVRETNEANSAINASNLAYNRESRDMAYKYQTDLYNKIYSDTSPSAKMEQYRQAGINPYFALGNVSPSQATASTAPQSSAPSALPMQAAHQDPVQYDFSGVGDAVNSYFNNSRLDADTQSRRIQNITQLDRDIADLRVKRSQENLNAKQAQHLDSQIKTLEKMRDIEYENAKRSGSFMEQQTENVKAEREVIRLNARSQDLNNQFLEWRNEYEKQHGAAELRHVDALVKEALASASASAASAVLAKAQERGVRIDNYQKNKLNWLIREEKKTQIQRNKFEMKYPTSANKAVKGFSQMFEGENVHPRAQKVVYDPKTDSFKTVP